MTLMRETYIKVIGSKHVGTESRCESWAVRVGEDRHRVLLHVVIEDRRTESKKRRNTHLIGCAHWFVLVGGCLDNRVSRSELGKTDQHSVFTE